MAMNKQIKIQKLDIETEKWSDYYICYAEINKANGREYFNARTNITENTFNFKVRYINKLNGCIYNTNEYRIIYKDNIFDVINVDDKQEKHLSLTFVANCKNL